MTIQAILENDPVVRDMRPANVLHQRFPQSEYNVQYPPLIYSSPAIKELGFNS